MNITEDIRDALLHAVEKRSPPPRTPMDLLTDLQDSWCEFPPGYLQTPVESRPRRCASLLRAHGALHDIKKITTRKHRTTAPTDLRSSLVAAAGTLVFTSTVHKKLQKIIDPTGNRFGGPSICMWTDISLECRNGLYVIARATVYA
ncbi:hypothetical protein AVEN_169619-1 [Araneus ventricosus]|uniref:Uncharacterized protein n=1 Tax=Araneus ventricosus TaxID=182803 RepID=A0A4Y2WQ35_ARAVE|nr:hypothetical protein AVEN_169619-1 [Araneus ventricosus]